MYRDVFDSISPIDYRYWIEEAAKYLSENANIQYQLLAELALSEVLCRRGFFSREILAEIQGAANHITAADVYVEEKRTQHDVRALVNCLRMRVSERARPYIHLFATSADIKDNANILRYKHAAEQLLLPKLLQLEDIISTIAQKEADTLQVGRTHGQHADPITFGFALAEYVDRIGGCIEELRERTGRLVGKFSGAVGAYNAASLYIPDPIAFEKEILAELDLRPALHSTQIASPEPLTRLLGEVVTMCGVLANLADDMRNLQRPEIAEVGEFFDEEAQVGSSAMPHKMNPWRLEGVAGFEREIMPRMMTVFLNQISEHQRDNRNSLPSRGYGEIIAYTVIQTAQLADVMCTLHVNSANMLRNLGIEGDLLLAEALYMCLAVKEYPDAHEVVRKLTLKARREKKTLRDVALEQAVADAVFGKAWFEIGHAHMRLFDNPSAYTGIASKEARKVVEYWTKKLFGDRNEKKER